MVSLIEIGSLVSMSYSSCKTSEAKKKQHKTHTNTPTKTSSGLYNLAFIHTLLPSVALRAVAADCRIEVVFWSHFLTYFLCHPNSSSYRYPKNRNLRHRDGFFSMLSESYLTVVIFLYCLRYSKKCSSTVCPTSLSTFEVFLSEM